MVRTLTDATTTGLERIARDRQRTGRVPGLVAGVCHGGELLWHTGVGAADISAPDVAPGPDHQYLIGSNTKTFTAVLVMQLRDEGKLTLDDPIDAHLPELTHQGVTIRSMLSHASGMQREPLGDIWETMASPVTAQLLAGFNEAERVGRAHHVFHYSNLVYSVLGELVARLDSRSWAQSLQARLLDPLGMTRTGMSYAGAHAVGYYVPPYTDVPVVEPVLEISAMAPCGGLMSTAADLARWSAFVADPPAEVLDPATMEEMLQPQIMTDTQQWTSAYGLGFRLLRSGTRVFAGHTGGMPGNISGLFTDRTSKAGAAVLMNNGDSPDPAAFAAALLDHLLDTDPELEQPWRPGTSVPSELRDLVGLWFTEGAGVIFSVREGRLEARMQGAPEHQPPAGFVPAGPDRFRTESGRERGELLRVTRDEQGAVVKMNWATYAVTRQPLAFGEIGG